jgi:leucyl aminopeptidase (aminopeptidase T)
MLTSPAESFSSASTVIILHFQAGHLLQVQGALQARLLRQFHGVGPIRDFKLLAEPKEVAVLAHADRLRLLQELCTEELTGAELARRLGLPANRVHYHLNQLLAAGLIAQTGSGRKRWHEERLYSRTARHFVVDPSILGGTESAASALKQSFENTFLEWRREDLLNVDLSRIARHMVTRGIAARQGWNVLLMHGPQGFDLAEQLHVELAAIGARALTRTWSPVTMCAMLDRFSADELREQPFVQPDQDASLDAVIFLSATTGDRPTFSPQQLERLPALMEIVSRWQNSLKERKLPYLEFALPFRREFVLKGEGPIKGASPEEAIEIFWRCIDTDHAVLKEKAERLRELLDPSGEVHLTCPLGTDLHMRVEPDTAFLLDGELSADDVSQGRVFEGLPAGTLNFFPVEGSAEGLYRADYTYQGGAHVEAVRLALKKGRISSIKALQNEAALNERMDSAVGDADLLSGLRIGLNPAGQGPTGKPVLDACLAGAVTLQFGNNELQGGKVRSTIDLILPACHLTLTSGARTLVKDGRLLP